MRYEDKIILVLEEILKELKQAHSNIIDVETAISETKED